MSRGGGGEKTPPPLFLLLYLLQVLTLLNCHFYEGGGRVKNSHPPLSMFDSGQNTFQLSYFTERVGTEKSPSLIFICPVQVKILLKCLFPVSDARGGATIMARNTPKLALFRSIFIKISIYLHIIFSLWINI